jgi:hypothetical protein
MGHKKTRLNAQTGFKYFLTLITTYLARLAASMNMMTM